MYFLLMGIAALLMKYLEFGPVTYVAFVCDLAKSSPRENAMVVPYHAGSSVVARCVPRIC